MLRQYLEQRHIDLDSGRSCLALEREYWQALEVLAAVMLFLVRRYLGIKSVPRIEPQKSMDRKICSVQPYKEFR